MYDLTVKNWTTKKRSQEDIVKRKLSLIWIQCGLRRDKDMLSGGLFGLIVTTKTIFLENLFGLIETFLENFVQLDNLSVSPLFEC